MKTILYLLTGFLRCRLINSPTGRYLERYYVGRLMRWTIYLHRFVDGDGERHQHNHPFHMSWSFVLAGRYTEISARHGIREVNWFNRIPGDYDYTHRIISAEPNTWTLFTHNERHGRHWGFIDNDGQYTPYPHSGAGWERNAPRGFRACRARYRPRAEVIVGIMGGLLASLAVLSYTAWVVYRSIPQ